VVLTDAFGCTATDSFAVTVNPQLVARAQLASLACFADTIQLAGSATGGSPAYSYRWDSTGVTFSTQQNLQLLGLTQSQTVVLTITDQQGCSDVDSLFIPLNNPITVDLGPDSLLCYGDSLQLNPAISGGSTPYASYTWRPASFLSDPSIRNPIIQNIIQTTPYILQVVDNTGCDALDTVTYTVNPQLIAHAGPDQLFCFGDSVQIGGSPSGSGGTAPFRYQWQPSAGLDDDTLANPIVRGINSRRNYSVRVTDAVGCAVSDSVLVVENPALSVEAGPRDTVCYGAATLLTAAPNGGSGQYSYSWSPANLLVDPTAASTSTQGLTASQLFTVTLTDSAGCTATDSVFIWVNPMMSVAISGDSFVCYEACAGLLATPTGGSGGFAYQWSPGDWPEQPDGQTPPRPAA
jgi:hypothetical protein